MHVAGTFAAQRWNVMTEVPDTEGMVIKCRFFTDYIPTF